MKDDSYLGVRENLAIDILRGDVTPTPEGLARHIVSSAKAGTVQAREWADRFVRELHADLAGDREASRARDLTVGKVR